MSYVMRGINSSAAEPSMLLAQSVSVTDKVLSVVLSEGRTISVPLAWYPRLFHSNKKQRRNWRLIGRGQGIHRPDIEEDISVSALILSHPWHESGESLENWLEKGKPRSQFFALLLVIIFLLIELAVSGCSEKDVAGKIRLDSGLDSSSEEPACTGGVYEGDYTITDADDMWRISECTEITGFLYINNTDLTNLDGLSKLTSIGQGVSIQANGALTSLEGLGQLKSAGGLLLMNNHSLEDLSGLNNLTVVDGSLSIFEQNVTELTALNHLTAVTSYIKITCNTPNFEGLNSLTSLGGDLYVTSEYTVNFKGLEGLRSIGGSLVIEDASELESFVGLDNVTTIGGNLEIKHNPKLRNLTGLDNVTSVVGNVNIGFCLQCDPPDHYASANDALTSLDGLENLASVGGDFAISGNSGLTNLNGIANLVSIRGDLFITDNDVLTDIKGLSRLESVNGIYTWENTLLNDYGVLEGVTRSDVQYVDYRYSYLRELDALSISPGTNYMRYLVDIRLPIYGVGDHISLVDDSWGTGGIAVLFGSYEKSGELITFEWPFVTGVAESPKKKVEIRNARIGRYTKIHPTVQLYGFSDEVEVTFIEERPTDFENYIQIKSAQWWPVASK
jgi:hypothetical protein